jgi:hypothetical protein
VKYFRDKKTKIQRCGGGISSPPPTFRDKSAEGFLFLYDDYSGKKFPTKIIGGTA